MKDYKIFFIWFITIIVSAGLFDLLPGIKYGEYVMPIAREKFDTKVYWEGSDWIKKGEHPYYKHEYNLTYLNYFKTKGQIPYVSETYPVLGIIYFSLPALFTNDFEIYQALMFCWNALWLLVLMLGIHKLLQLMHTHWTNLLFILLPSFLYFTFNRYDIFPSALVIWSIYYLFRSKYDFSFILLAFGILVKIYPILLLPIYLVYLKERQIDWSKYLWLTAGLGMVTLVVSILWAGWWPAIGPYIMHWLRTETGGSLIFSLKLLINNEQMFYVLKPIFKVLSIIVPVITVTLLCFKKNWGLTLNQKNFISIASLSLVMPVIFGFFYSNQWVLWFIPLLLTLGSWPLLAGVLIHDVVNYLQFPIIGSIAASFKSLAYNWFVIIALLRSFLLIIILIILIGYFIKNYSKTLRLLSTKNVINKPL